MDKAQKRLMSESFDLQGTWFLPEQDMTKDGVEGILKYSPDKIVLELIGTFRGERDEMLYFLQQSPEKKTIYGFSNYGEKMSLFDCFSLGVKMNAPGFNTTSYIVNCFFAGTQFVNSNSERIIKSCEVSLTYLDAWLDTRIVDITTNQDTNNASILIDTERVSKNKKHITIDSENIMISEELSRRIVYPKEYYSEETTKIVVNRFYKLSSTNGELLYYDDCYDNLHKLRRLLALLIGSPLHFLFFDIEFVSEIIENEIEMKQHCRVFFTQVGNINKTQSISPHKPGTVLIFRKDIIDSMEDIFCNWFSLQEKLAEIVNPYINDLYIQTYIETIFLNTVRGLETYHRYFPNEVSEEPQIIDAKFEEERTVLLSFIAERISDENKQDFIDRINYEDEGSLQKRLKELLRQTPTSLMERLFGKLNSKQTNKMIHAITQTRNYYTHRDDKQKYPLVIDNHNILNNYIKKLNVILQYWVLRCIGIEGSLAEKSLIEHKKNNLAFSTMIKN